MVPARAAAAQIAAACVERDPVAVARQGLAERRQLDRHLDGVRQAEAVEAVEQRDVGSAGGRGVGGVGDVLAEVVDGDEQAALDQRADRRHRRVEVVARDEAADEAAGRRRWW